MNTSSEHRKGHFLFLHNIFLSGTLLLWGFCFALFAFFFFFQPLPLLRLGLGEKWNDKRSKARSYADLCFHT